MASIEASEHLKWVEKQEICLSIAIGCHPLMVVGWWDIQVEVVIINHNDPSFPKKTCTSKISQEDQDVGMVLAKGICLIQSLIASIEERL